MVGSPGDYEIPKSHNMLSHLTNERAFDDYTVSWSPANALRDAITTNGILPQTTM